ncbi:MAG: Spore protein YabP [Eubacteriales bacterium SKADARSKE-1]|nr:Spore protein YabP [Eubacteriales bacterium SKADARSKE-1]
MPEETKKAKVPHGLILKDRQALSITGVLDVDSFDEQTVVAYTDQGELTIKGAGLHIIKINLDNGDLSLDGQISSLAYSEGKHVNKSLFSKLFK